MASVAAPPVQTKPTEWPALTRVAFRFAFCYLVLYCLIAFNNVLEFLPYDRFSQLFVPWVGRHILHLAQPITYFISGSGDKTSDWVLLFCHLAVSLFATLVWSIFDRRKEYARLNEWLHVLIRYSLAANMFAYGSAKVVKLQFSDPYPTKLIQPLHDFSPMGLLWTFMGASTAYTFFAGACELLGGVLLLFRRTATLGALVTGAVMFNVAMLNYAYDVPVKLLATHLVLMCGYLAIPDLRALFDFLVRNRPAAPAPVRAHFAAKRWRIAGWVAKTLAVGYLLVTSAMGMVEGYSQYGQGARKPPLYGIWDVEEFTRDGVTLPPLLTDTVRWRQFINQNATSIAIRGMDDARHSYTIRFETARSKIWSNNVAVPLELTWSRPDTSHLVLTGTIGGDTYNIRMKRLDESKFTLLSRGFHWVSERPFNR
ncbi:MAG TPA: hypothetical protein VHW09_23970 [Bryobacteraceae bacterium]|jgi:uncharacterized membrane protein YphA (DoxX/SURF4 family)|nr:hypothetical protein [Bryobacteraceae bacterium]